MCKFEKMRLVCFVFLFLVVSENSFSQKLWPVSTSDGHVLIDIAGKTVKHLPSSFSFVDQFREGLALFEDTAFNVGFVDCNGDVAFYSPCRTFFREGLASCFIDGHLCFIDTKGAVVLRPKHGRYLVGGDYPKNRFAFSEGVVALPIIMESGEDDIEEKYIFMDKVGRIVFGREFKYADDFSEGLAFVVDGKGRHGYIDKKGFMRIHLPTDVHGECFSNGYALIRNQKDGCFFINKKGEQLATPELYDAQWFSEGLAAVKLKEFGGKYWGFVDTAGRMVVDPIYDYVEPYSSGLAPVYHTRLDSNSEKYIATFVLDRSGVERFGPFRNLHLRQYLYGLALGHQDLVNGCVEYLYINTAGVVVRRDTTCHNTPAISDN